MVVSFKPIAERRGYDSDHGGYVRVNRVRCDHALHFLECTVMSDQGEIGFRVRWFVGLPGFSIPSFVEDKLKKELQGYTVYSARGVWKGHEEDTTIFEVIVKPGEVENTKKIFSALSFNLDGQECTLLETSMVSFRLLTGGEC